MKVGKSVSGKTRDLVWNSICSSVRYSVSHSVCGSDWNLVDDLVWGSVRSAVPSSNNLKKSAKRLIVKTIDEL